MIDNTFILRAAMAVILLTHSVSSIATGDVNDFGELYLNQIGFSPLGVPIAWAVKLSHVACAILLVINKYIKPAAIVTITILLMGIILVHWPEGWFVVGYGRNGMEYNFLLICVLLFLMYPNGLKRNGRLN